MDRWTIVSHFITLANHMRTFLQTPTSKAEAKALHRMIDYYDELACLAAPLAMPLGYDEGHLQEDLESLQNDMGIAPNISQASVMFGNIYSEQLNEILELQLTLKRED